MAHLNIPTIGNSLGLALPEDLLSKLGLIEGDSIPAGAKATNPFLRMVEPSVKAAAGLADNE